MTETSYDAIIVGSGHNGICLAAYLQRAGLQVAIFERRFEEGGAVFSAECTAPGFIHNLHANFIGGIFADLSPFYKDFELEKFGGRLIYPDTQSGIPFSDGRPPIVLWNVANEENIAKTHKSIAQYSKADADTYVELTRKGLHVFDHWGADYFSAPTLPTEDDPDPNHTAQINLMKAMGLPPHYIMGTGRELLDRLFESPELRTLLYKQVEEFGTALEMMHTGANAFGGITIAALNWRISVGGTHSLAHAMAMAAVNEGVHIYENSPVVKVLIKGGKAVGVKLKDGTEVKANKLVASGADLKQSLLKLVGEDIIGPVWAKRARDFKVGNTSTLASTAWALHEAPNYKSAKHDPHINKTFYTVVGYDCPDDVLQCKRAARAGWLPEHARGGTWTNSLWDPTYAPPGKHSLTGWFDFPDASAFTRDEWEEIRNTYNDKFLKTFEKFAPNMTRDNVIGDFFYPLLDQEEEMGLADWMGGSIRPDQLGAFRPFPEAAAAMYHVPPLENFYMCGPCMYPGGSVSAGPGYNAFKIIAEDFGLDKFWEKLDRGY